MLQTYLQVCLEESQPSVENRDTPSRVAQLRILLAGLSHSVVSRGVSAHPRLLIADVSALASVSEECPFEVVWVGSEQRMGIERFMSSSQPRYHVLISCNLVSCI